MANDPTPTEGSTGLVERSRLVHFDLHFWVDGPKTDDDPEPWDTLVNWSPASTPMNLPEVGRGFTKQTNGDWILVIHVEGLPAGQQGLILLEIDHAGSEDPIETFTKFDSLAKKWGANFPDGQKFEGWKRKIKDPSTGETVPNPYYGQTHYLNDTAILRCSFLSPTFDPKILWNICKIDTSLVPDKAKPYLIKQGNQDWLKRSVKGAFRGNVWQFDIEWMLGVWAPDIYSPLVTGQPLEGVADWEIQNLT